MKWTYKSWHSNTLRTCVLFDVEEMKDTGKLGRVAWIAFLITATPAALFCVGMTFLWTHWLFVEEIGPIEELPLPSLQKAIVLTSIISLPITWILGITIGHRFNRPMLRTIPFLANMLPTTGLLWFSSIMARDEGGEFVWMTAYIGLLATLLGLGMIAALAIQKDGLSGTVAEIVRAGD